MGRGVIVFLGLLSAFVSSGMSQAEVKIGLLLSLTGPLAAEGKRAHDEVKAVFGTERQVELVVYDDQTKSDVAAEAAQRMAVQDRVVAVVGPLTVGLTMAVAPRLAATRLPTISLAAPSGTGLRSLLERNPSLVMFSPISPMHIDVVGRYMRRTNVSRIELAYFNPGSVEYVEEIAARLGQTAGRFETILKAPVGTRDEARLFAEQTKGKQAIIIGAVTAGIADSLVAELRRQDLRPPTVLYIPPDIKTKARVAARLINDAVKRGARSPEDLAKAVESSKIFDRDRRALAVDWSVLTYAISPEVMRELKATSGETTSCTCNSKDGKVCKQKSCPAGQKCKKDETEDDCSMECTAS